MSRFLVLALLVVAAACGGKSTPATSSVEHADHMAGAEHKMEHDNLPPTVAAFHAKLSPLWHAEPGDGRTEATCGATGEMDQQLEDVENAGAPAGTDAALWTERVTALRTSWTALSDDCVGAAGAHFADKFEAAHNDFHALIELLPPATK